MENIQLRRLQPGDSIEQLADLLRRAFARLGEMGVPCSCVYQSPKATRRRTSTVVTVSSRYVALRSWGQSP
ncbi:hypothetical protein SBBP2_2230011 [Burkholderiales bacterium]|nr:hypothetical protein SBBP2_2230011 [Burkholderiales bacterium]